MELLEHILVRLTKPTHMIKTDLLQELLTAIRKFCGSSTECTHLTNKILNELWDHLENGLPHIDDQLLCATAFFSVLSKADTVDVYLRNSEIIIKNELQKHLNESKEKLAVTLAYGLFQSSYLMNSIVPLERSFPALKTLLESVFNLLICKAHEYSQYTFIIFKTMTSFKKVIGSCIQDIIFNKDNQIRLLNMVNHNWENPIIGIRNMNRIIFHNLILILDKQIYTVILQEINNFHWNKAKYLMLTEIIEIFNGDIVLLIHNNQWVEGVLRCLQKPGLVSAGTDMYFAILKKLKCVEDWTFLFFNGIVDILSGQSQKAIENFSNYWCLATLRAFPLLLQTLTKEINADRSEIELFSGMSLLKYGNKLGLLRISWCSPNKDQVAHIILTSLQHFKPSVRIMAFEILCVSSDNVMPTQLVYENILIFLMENVSSDCTNLRISMLNNLSIFLTKLHQSFMTQYTIDKDETKLNFHKFCNNLQNFIKNSFEYQGNYQRKITTVKVTDIVLKSFSNIPLKHKKGKQKISLTLVNFLKERDSWFLHDKDFLLCLINLLRDPATDICENVSQILLTYYLEELCEVEILNSLIEDAIKCTNSKFFYEISCGQHIFKLVSKILIKQNIDIKFKNIEDIFIFGYNSLKDEYNSQLLVVSIDNGKQLHAFVNILHVVLEVSIQQSYKIKLPKETLLNLVDILEHISNQFAWEKENISADFSKMSDMVQCLITRAGYDPKHEKDETKISHLYQLFLNCLWLNVKASCELSSALIRYNMDVATCEKCLYIITNVLETSRHKGAIEAAGVAMGDAVRYLTSLPESHSASKLPATLLEKKLNELINETNKTSSITRRGAGLSIMVHRIVSNDYSRGKPLFQYFMKVLLSKCNSIVSTDLTDVNKEDLPKAIYIHFMTRIVMDSSLASDMIFYATELGDLAFKNLTDEHWQIRNAALQLYGALIPKLIGQKKSCGPNEEKVVTVACDEFQTHFPGLWTYITQRIQDHTSKDIIQSHSNLVPILNVLASMGNRYTFSYHLNENDLNDLVKNLFQLLGSPIYVVRRLTAIAITNISTPTIFSQIMNVTKPLSENYFHGILLLISYFGNVKDGEHINIIERFRKQINNIKHSYLCRMYYDNLINEHDFSDPVIIIKSVLEEVHCNQYEPGIFIWADKQIENCIENSCLETMPQILKALLNYSNFENCCSVLYKKLKIHENISERILTEISHSLLMKNHNSSITWEILYHISLRSSLHEIIDAQVIITHLNRADKYKTRYIIPLAARIFIEKGDNSNLTIVSRIIRKLSNQDTTDIDMRIISAKANNELAHDFLKLEDNIKVKSIESAIILLQDEDENVRYVSSFFYSYIMKEKVLLHSFVCLFKIMDMKFMRLVFDEPTNGVRILCQDLLKYVNSINVNENSLNPFANELKNIYMEICVFKKLINSLTGEI